MAFYVIVVTFIVKHLLTELTSTIISIYLYFIQMPIIGTKSGYFTPYH